MNILIVDDTAEMRTMLCSLLRESATKIFTAENGKLALTFIEENNIDVVLTDVDMPEMNGIELTRELRSNKGYKGKIIATSGGYPGLTPNELLETLRDAGANYFLLKPYQRSELLALLTPPTP